MVCIRVTSNKGLVLICIYMNLLIYFYNVLLSFIIKCFFLYLYNHCDESMYAHSSIKYFSLPYNFADANELLLLPIEVHPLVLDYSSGY